MAIRSIFKQIKCLIVGDTERAYSRHYFRNYMKYSFTIGKCLYQEQYEGCITRLYHTIEKGLAFENYKPGFGYENINALVSEMEKYSHNGFDTSLMFYRTALDVLKRYIKKNQECNAFNPALEKRVNALTGQANGMGGTLQFYIKEIGDIQKMGYKEFVKSRHSVRHFTSDPVELSRVIDALNIAQYTPSACNRQGWKTYIVTDKGIIQKTLRYQNGNRGFGQEIDKLLVVVGDLRFFNRNRELHQVYIDSGMYAMSIINALHYEKIGTIPLSGSLRKNQQKNVKKLLSMSEAEIITMFIGVGNLPERIKTTRSQRHQPRYVIVDDKV